MKKLLLAAVQVFLIGGLAQQAVADETAGDKSVVYLFTLNVPHQKEQPLKLRLPPNISTNLLIRYEEKHYHLTLTAGDGTANAEYTVQIHCLAKDADGPGTKVIDVTTLTLPTAGSVIVKQGDGFTLGYKVTATLRTNQDLQPALGKPLPPLAPAPR